MFWISSGIQLGLIISNLWSQRNTGTLFASLVIRASKSVFAIFIFAFVLVISGIPPISDIAQITQTVTNPAGISLKTQVCLMVLVKISDSSQKSVSKSGNDLSKVGKTSESRKSSDTFQKSPGSRMHSIDGIYEGRKKSIDILKETDILEEEIL